MRHPFYFLLVCERWVQGGSYDLRAEFQNHRCLTAEPQFELDTEWILEVNPWTSHELVSTIAGVILRDYIGYSVDLNVIASPERVYERCAREWDPGIDGATISEASDKDEEPPYANLEVWSDYWQEKHLKYVTVKKKVTELGHMAYGGLPGLFISRSFAFSQQPPVEHFRAFDLSFTYGQQVVAAMRKEANVSCAATGVCCCKPGAECEMFGGGVTLCPTSDAGTLPLILGGSLNFNAPRIEQLAQGNNLRFAVQWHAERETNFKLAFQSLAYGSSALVFAQRPSYLLALLRSLDPVEVNSIMMPREPVRISFPLDNCKRLGSSNAAQQDAVCDFSASLLVKLSSNDVARDPIAKKFFEGFSVPPESVDASGSCHGRCLTMAGVENLLFELAKNIKEDRLANPSEVLDVACRWVKDNEGRGVDWTRWVLRREQPFIADLLSNPILSLLIMTIVSLIWIMLWEHFYLRTTLSPFLRQGIWKKSESFRLKYMLADGTTWRNPIEARLKETARTLIDPKIRRKISQESKDQQHELPMDAIAHSDQADEVALEPRNSSLRTSSREVEFTQKQDFGKRLETAYISHKMLEKLPANITPEKDRIAFALHTFPSFPKQGEAVIVLSRMSGGVKSTSSVSVSVQLEECGGGAKNGADFTVGEQIVTFERGNELAVLRLPIKYHKDLWRNTVWFQVRLSCVNHGDAVLSTPDRALVLLLDEDVWPANIPPGKRGGQGISLLRYLWKSDTRRRGDKWRKTMYAMLWLPVHSVFVSTIVQKLMVDHVVEQIKQSVDEDTSADWFYWEGLLLVVVQLISLGLHRWADVVQTRNRGRTGGIRQFHRAEMARKFLFMEHAEHWVASDAQWFYAAIYDADVLVSKAYFQVYVLFQSLFALFLSVLIVIGLTLWGYSQKSGGSTIGHLRYLIVAFVAVGLSAIGVYERRKLTWATVIMRKNQEAHWFRGLSWIMHNWRQFHVLDWSERAVIDKLLTEDNGQFVPAHQTSRDTSNDTSWVAKWLQGCSYCFILLFGLYALIQSRVYGLGGMEVGTYYALLKVFNTVGKYSGKLSGVVAEFQRAIVSIRDVAAILNQMEQTSQREIGLLLWRYFDAEKLESGRGKRCLDLEKFSSQRWRALGFQFLLEEEQHLIFEAGCCFQRPPGDFNVGIIFGDFKMLRELKIPIGRLVCLYGSDERVLSSVLGVISGVLHATGASSDWVDDSSISLFLCPRGLRCRLIPINSTSITMYTSGADKALTNSDKSRFLLITQLKMSGADEALCRALAEYAGLKPDMDISYLPQGDLQVFMVVKAILYDPDVLCAYHHQVLPPDTQHRIVMLLMCWQMCGGLPQLANLWGMSLHDTATYRTCSRTLIFGNCWDLFDDVKSKVSINLDDIVGQPQDPLQEIQEI